VDLVDLIEIRQNKYTPKFNKMTIRQIKLFENMNPSKVFLAIFSLFLRHFKIKFVSNHQIKLNLAGNLIKFLIFGKPPK